MHIPVAHSRNEYLSQMRYNTSPIAFFSINLSRDYSAKITQPLEYFSFCSCSGCFGAASEDEDALYLEVEDIMCDQGIISTEINWEIKSRTSAIAVSAT